MSIFDSSKVLIFTAVIQLLLLSVLAIYQDYFFLILMLLTQFCVAFPIVVILVRRDYVKPSKIRLGAKDVGPIIFILVTLFFLYTFFDGSFSIEKKWIDAVDMLFSRYNSMILLLCAIFPLIAIFGSISSSKRGEK